MRAIPPWVAVLAGVVATLLTLAFVAGTGLAVGWLFARDATESVRERSAVAWGAGGAVLAFATGGWTATRVSRLSPGAGGRAGCLVGMLTLAALVGGGWILLQDSADLHSVGVELGIVEIADPAAVPVPDSRAPGEPEGVDLGALARTRTITVAGYLTALVALLLAAAVLGGIAWAGGRRRAVTLPGKAP